jgi:hypothetical protein
MLRLERRAPSGLLSRVGSNMPIPSLCSDIALTEAAARFDRRHDVAAAEARALLE